MQDVERSAGEELAVGNTAGVFSSLRSIKMTPSASIAVIRRA